MPFGAVHFGDVILIRLTKLYFSENFVLCFGPRCSIPIEDRLLVRLYFVLEKGGNWDTLPCSVFWPQILSSPYTISE